MRPSTTARLRLVIVGNSVSLSPAEGIAAYPELLHTRLQDQWRIFTVIKGGQTIDEFEPGILSLLEDTLPHAVTLQVGVNECGPRPLKRQEREWLGGLRPHLLRSAIIRVLHQFRPYIIRARGPNQFTSIPLFADTVHRIIAKARSLGSSVLLLPITHVSRAAEARQPFFNREIDRYNDTLRSCKENGVSYLDEQLVVGDLRPEQFCITPESVHLNAWAHEKLAACIADWLERQVHPNDSLVGKQQ
jgi:lysophospholipase L1-like esterase